MTAQLPDWLMKGLRDNAVKLIWGGLVFVIVAGGAMVRDRIKALLDLPAIYAADSAQNKANDNARAAMISDIRAEGASRDEAIIARIEALADIVTMLRLPDEVFEIGQTSGAVGGFCVEGQPCNITVRIRRTAEGEACRIIVGGTAYYFANAETAQRRQVYRIGDNIQERNVGLEWSDLDFTFITPRGLVEDPQDGAFVFIATYTQCSAETDLQVVTDESDMIPIKVYRTTGDVQQ